MSEFPSNVISSEAVRRSGFERAEGLARIGGAFALTAGSEASERSERFRTRRITPQAAISKGRESKRRARKISNLNRALLKDVKTVNGNMDRRAKCGRALVSSGSKVVVKRHSYGNVFTSGLQTCGSVWSCPSCIPKIKRARAELVNDLVQAHKGVNGGFALLTLTVPHRKRNSLKELLNSLNKSFDNLKKGGEWQALKKKYDIGYVKALEFTYSREHSYHPHFHVLLFLNKDVNPHVNPKEWGELETYFKKTWAVWVKKTLGRKSNAVHGVDLRPVYGLACIADYLSSISKELARSDYKKAATGNMSMMDVAEAAAEGESWALHVWKEFLELSKGKRFMTYSQGLVKGLLGDDKAAKITDEELAAKKVYGKDELGVSIETWKLLNVVRDGVADFLWNVETFGRLKAQQYIADLTGIEPTVSWDQDLPIIELPETALNGFRELTNRQKVAFSFR